MKAKELGNLKDQKKISPDYEDDQDKKTYGDEDAMDLLLSAGASTGDDYVALDGDSNDPEEPDVAKSKKETSDDKIEEGKDLDKIVGEVLDEEGDEEGDTSETPEPKMSSREEDKKVDVQEVIAKKDAQIAELTEKVRSLEERVSKLGNVQNVVKELGFDKLQQHELVNAMKELKTAAFEFVNNKSFLDIVEGFASGKFKLADQEEKPVSAYMPKGLEEEYDHYEAFNDPRSYSWKAREAWEQDRRRREYEMQKLVESVTSRKKALEDAGGDELISKIKEYKKIASSRMKSIRKFAVEEYEDGEALFEEFREKLQTLDEDILKTAIAVIAKKTNRPSRISKKIRDNKGKVFAESKVSRGVGDRGDEDLVIIDQEVQKDLEDTFLDWRNNDLHIVR